MYHKKYKAYFKYMKKCPTNDCKVKKAAKENKSEEKKEETPKEDERVDDFFDF